MKASDYIAGFLHAQNVTHVYEVIGGMTTHLADSIYRQGKIQLVSMHHEQAAAFAADAMARITGVPGVAMATSGPGATNLLTGIGSCYFDSTPAVFITGQVNTYEQKGDRLVRQLGFQETDIVSMARPITKAAWSIQSVDQLLETLPDAFAIALAGRPGPVLLDIPMDVQRADIPVPPPFALAFASHARPAPRAVDQLLGGLAAARRPLILAGGGITSARSLDSFREFVARIQVPVVNSLMAVDALPHDHPLRVGMIGSYGNRWANLALGRSDFLLVLGSRLDIRQTGADTEAFKSHRSIYHVDCEPGEINNRVSGCYGILSHLAPFFVEAGQAARSRTWPARPEWLAEIDGLKRAWPDSDELRAVPGINPNVFMHQLAAASRLAGAFMVDVGQHQMWAAQSLDLGIDQAFITSGGMGAMGFSLPAAIGAALARPDKPIIVIAGDGGMQLNVQELQTVMHYRLPVKMIVINNGVYGMVRQFQQSYFESRYPGTVWGYSAPDFARVAQAYGIAACTAQNPADLPGALAALWSDPSSPFLLQVVVDASANAYPKIAFGRPFTEMEPLASPIDMEGT